MKRMSKPEIQLTLPHFDMLLRACLIRQEMLSMEWRVWMGVLGHLY